MGNLNVVRMDADKENSDWTKTSWDLPPYRSPEFDEVVPDLEAFKKGLMYRAAVESGLIVGDEWAGDDDESPEDDLATRIMQAIKEEEEGENASDEKQD